MRASWHAALGALAAGALACARLDAPAPAPRSVEPARGYAGARTPVVIRGDGFAARAAQASGGSTEVDVSHRAWLGGVPLEAVTWVDAHTLEAVVPPGLPAGLLPLVVENSFGRRGQLDRAFEVVASAGAVLTVTVEAAPALVSVGQLLPVTVRVTNSGFAAARDVTASVTPTLAGGAGVSLVGPSPPSAAALDPGDALTFTWSCVATSAGQVTLSASSAGTDAFSGTHVESAPAATGFTVQLPAGLVATLQASRSTASTGQEVAVTLTVTNGGDAGADLTAIAPRFSPGLATTCTAPAPGLPVTVTAATSAAFTWACTSAVAGTLTLGATVSGADANSGAPLSAEPAVLAEVAIQTPAALVAAVALPPGMTTVSVGQPLLVTFTVSNTGGASASLGSVTAATAPAAAACGAPAPAPPYPLAGGASVAFTWTCTPALPGPLSLGGAVAGADANTGAPLAATAAPSSVTVQLPAAIAAIVSANRTVASVGQAIGVALTVTNGGAAAANVSGVEPLTSGTAAATCAAVTPAPPLTIPPGEARAFTWSCTGATAGSLALSARVSGTDANSGAAISATPATAATVTVQAAASLSASAFTATPTTASAGQAIAVSLTVANSGAASASVSAVAPTVSPSTSASCTAASPAPPQSIAGGASRTFTWSCTVSAAGGARSLGAPVTWNDVNTGTGATLTPAPIAVTIQAPAALTPIFTAGASSVNAGQPVAVSLTLTSSGGAAASVTAVAPSLEPAAAATCTAASPAPPRTIAGGASLTFTWTCTATTTGSRTLRAAVTAADANSGAPLPVSVPGLPLEVQAPAAISAAISAPGSPATVPIGAPVSLSLAVTNSGQATASLASVSPSVSPAGAAACTAPSPAPPTAVPGGAIQPFTWSCTASRAGAISLGASVAGTDANSGTALAATASPEVPITAIVPASLTATVAAAPGTATVGQAVEVTFTLTNGGTGAATITGIAPSAAGVGASCGAVSPALPQSVAPAASAAFAWTCTATAAGALALSGTATGTDAVSGLPVGATPAAAAGVTVQTPPALGVTAFSASRATANVGQAVGVSLSLANGGGATAAVGTVAPTFTPSGAGSCTAATPAAPVSIPGGGSATLTWSCTGTGAASASLGVVLAATDANTGAAAPVSATPLPLTVQAPAALSAAPLEVTPTTATVGQAIAVSLTLTDTGGASALVSSVIPTVSPPGAAACGVVSPALPVTLAGGSGRTFTWTCVPSAAAVVSLGATVAAIDANSGAGLAPAVAGAGATILTPAALTAAVAIGGGPTVVDVGTPLAVTLTVSDTGGASAAVSTVTPTVSGAGAATCGAPTPAPPTPLASGGTATYGWTCTPTAPGSVTLGATVAGTDAVSGAPLSAAASAAPITVQAPAALTATVAASRSVASVGQAVAFTLTLTNTGGAGATVTAAAPAATGAASTCTQPSPAPPLAIPGGQAATLTWSCTPDEAGTMSVGASASGTDATSGAALAASATPVPVTVQVPASLTVSAFAAARATANPGQRIDLTLTVRNQGGATAQLSEVTPSVEPAGAGSCTAAAPAPPQILAGGASLNFTWSCAASVAGSVELGATVTATDGNSGAAAGATAPPLAVQVQVPAALAGAVSGTPSPQLVDQPISFALTLTNTGGAGANVTGVTVTRNPGNVTCSAASPAPPQTIPGGQGLGLAWTCTASQARTYTIGATVTAADANTGAAVPAAVTSFTASWATTISAAALTAAAGAPPLAVDGAVLAVSSDALGDGTASGAIVLLGGDVLVGSDASGATLVRFDPSSGASQHVPLALGVDAGATPAENAAWRASAPATTLGRPGCTPGSLGCGPDDEAGLAAIATGIVDGAERLAVAGAGPPRYVYVASSADGLLEGAWLDLRAVLPQGGSPGVALLASATLGGLVVAADGGAGGPRVVIAPRMPGAAGLDVAPGDARALGAADPAGAGAPALAEAGGVLYVGAAGGIARWEAGWRDATPAHPAWTARTSAPLPASPAWPRDRAIPGLAAFGACGGGPCVIAGRNVAGAAGGPPVVPQLWRCTPSAGFGACAPEDWGLVSPDPADAFVTRLGAPGGGAISLVVTTREWLYVGLDDDALGARLYRASRAPAVAADLAGRGGCSAASPDCEGLGGNGLGSGATRLAGAVWSDADASLWVLAGDGGGPLRLLRVPDR